MPSFNIHQAKTHLSRLLARVERGETIAIARAGVTVALLVPAGGRVPAAGRVREGAATLVASATGRRGARLARCLEREVWPEVPPEVSGRPLTRAEEDDILGFGPTGV